jgi:hypothetical protein
VAIRDRLLKSGVVRAETLAKALLPVPAPNHSGEVIRRGQDKTDGKKNVVENTHSARW